MKLGEFIKNFTHNNIVRLVYKTKEGHQTVLDNWDEVSMDHEILKAKGKNRHFIHNEVLGLVGISGMNKYSDAINIVIEKLEHQPFIEEKEKILNYCESV